MIVFIAELSQLQCSVVADKEGETNYKHNHRHSRKSRAMIFQSPVQGKDSRKGNDESEQIQKVEVVKT
ncbi:hypothetical protein D9V86_10105 [Bacteroidetes/Chlorobi group bacterium ChocPot_Mid]|nr:MAG: hypothetical protein D9V86_10105 [Bacteroidetes/Chlorobi group bacterium ChocPot_Mid]